MKKLISFVLAAGMMMTSAEAYDFPVPDWGALLNEKTIMVNEKDLELYAEGSTESAPYYGAKFEPRSGVYIGKTAERTQEFEPLGSVLAYVPWVAPGDSVTVFGWNVSSLNNVNYDEVRNVFAQLDSYGKPVIIRYAGEMNVSSLGDDPDLYRQVFRNVADIAHSYPNLAVVWSPNDNGALDRPFEYYYPGDEYVDWIGVSSYQKMYFLGNKNTSFVDSVYFMTGDYAWTTNTLKPIIKFMEKNNIQKPLMISEGGVVTNNNAGDDQSVIKAWNIPRMRNMYYNTIMKYPQIKMINYFDLNKPEPQTYDISDTDYAKEIFKEAAGCGAYLRSTSDKPEFVFTKANSGQWFEAKDGIVDLYTLAYIPNNKDITVHYRIDGQWFHLSHQAPYKCMLAVDSVTDGDHTMTIECGTDSKTYSFHKWGQYIWFDKE